MLDKQIKEKIIISDFKLKIRIFIANSEYTH